VLGEEKTEEFRRQQQLAARADLRIRMETETKNSKLNNLKIRNQWRKIMRLAKTESLKKDIEILSQNHERDVDRKDAILQMLDRDLEEAEDQVKSAGGKYLTGKKETNPNVYYEVKYKTPEGIVFDITESGWKGAVKDVTPS
jgi:hypothetical protein